MKTIQSLLAGAFLLAAPSLAHAAEGEGSKRSVAVFAALLAVFCGVGTIFLAAVNGKKK